MHPYARCAQILIQIEIKLDERMILTRTILRLPFSLLRMTHCGQLSLFYPSVSGWDLASFSTDELASYWNKNNQSKRSVKKIQ